MASAVSDEIGTTRSLSPLPRTLMRPCFKSMCERSMPLSSPTRIIESSSVKIIALSRSAVGRLLEHLRLRGRR